MSFLELLQAFSSLPQIIETVKNMKLEELDGFLAQLGLEGKEKEDATGILRAFQEDKPLSPEEQRTAQNLLEKALEMNQLDMGALMNLVGAGSEQK